MASFQKQTYRWFENTLRLFIDYIHQSPIQKAGKIGIPGNICQENPYILTLKPG
jgi:hypothetical protein